MVGNRWTWMGLLVVLVVAAAAIASPVAARSTASMEPLTWTLPPTPDETPEETIEEETPVDTVEEETPIETIDEETPIETLETETTLNDVAPEETLIGSANDTAGETVNETANETAIETGPAVVVETDEATPAATTEATPAETSTAELPTFTPIQAAQVNGSATQAAPLSLAGIILAVAVAGLLVVFGRNRK